MDRSASACALSSARCRTSLSRCDSPPESVLSGWHEPQITEADFVQNIERIAHFSDSPSSEKTGSLIHGELEDVVN